MKYTMYNSENDCLYIRSDIILPKKDYPRTGDERKKQMKKMAEAFKMSYEERIEKFAPEDAKKEIKEQLELHKGCRISEYTDMF